MRLLAAGLVAAAGAGACSGEALESRRPAGDAGAAGAPPVDGGGAGGGGGGGVPDAGDPGLVLLTLNLHCLKLDGTSFPTNEARFGAIADLIAAEGVAVVTLQEACVRQDLSAIDALRAAVEARTGATWSQSWTFAHVAWEGTPDQADEGVGLLVRGALADPVPIEHRVQGALRRVAVAATLPPELGALRVLSVHFEVGSEPARAAQAREAAVSALVETDPGMGAVVAGDFNDIEGSATHGALAAMGFLDAAAGLDPAGIDHAFIHRAAPWRPADARLVFLGADAVSDHPGVLVRFEAAAAEPVTITRIEGAADVGAGHWLSVRGSAAPLSWDTGWTLRQTGPSTWKFVTTELDGAFAFKLLRDDIDWQLGADVPGSAGQDHVVTPSF
ncbi:MAG: endonuclease/exonuclease/phosphatase family protein [Polyangiaceae bacterium]|nr:endonuclease/exonuclease/phosphatase family protein [Polyangiaceae bacterium]